MPKGKLEAKKNLVRKLANKKYQPGLANPKQREESGIFSNLRVSSYLPILKGLKNPKNKLNLVQVEVLLHMKSHQTK